MPCSVLREHIGHSSGAGMFSGEGMRMRVPGLAEPKPEAHSGHSDF